MGHTGVDGQSRWGGNGQWAEIKIEVRRIPFWIGVM
jgi:hypothetical protein